MVGYKTKNELDGISVCLRKSKIQTCTPFPHVGCGKSSSHCCCHCCETAYTCLTQKNLTGFVKKKEAERFEI